MNADGTGTIHVRGDEETGTKNSETRIVPIIPEMHQLLKRLSHEASQSVTVADPPKAESATRRHPNPSGPVMRVTECQKAIDSAMKRLAEGELGADGNKLPPIIVPRITHHDLRHLFATRCIESGVDIPTVARWLGHKDGGALAMRTYGHLRQEHSMSMASKVRFGTAPVSGGRSSLEEAINVFHGDTNPPELAATA